MHEGREGVNIGFADKRSRGGSQDIYVVQARNCPAGIQKADDTLGFAPYQTEADYIDGRDFLTYSLNMHLLESVILAAFRCAITI